MITPRVKLETQSFTYVSRNTGKEELVNLNESDDFDVQTFDNLFDAICNAKETYLS